LCCVELYNMYLDLETKYAQKKLKFSLYKWPVVYCMVD
jgi:hypothetical protein